MTPVIILAALTLLLFVGFAFGSETCGVLAMAFAVMTFVSLLASDLTNERNQVKKALEQEYKIDIYKHYSLDQKISWFVRSKETNDQLCEAKYFRDESVDEWRIVNGSVSCKETEQAIDISNLPR